MVLLLKDYVIHYIHNIGFCYIVDQDNNTNKCIFVCVYIYIYTHTHTHTHIETLNKEFLRNELTVIKDSGWDRKNDDKKKNKVAVTSRIVVLPCPQFPEKVTFKGLSWIRLESHMLLPVTITVRNIFYTQKCHEINFYNLWKIA